MSYDLYFWRENGNLELGPADIRERIGNGEDVEGIEHFNIDLVKKYFVEAFPEMEISKLQMIWKDAHSGFEIGWSVSTRMDTTQMIVITCGYELLKNSDLMNKIIDAGCNLGCALYDPQIDKRFEQPESRAT